MGCGVDEKKTWTESWYIRSLQVQRIWSQNEFVGENCCLRIIVNPWNIPIQLITYIQHVEFGHIQTYPICSIGLFKSIQTWHSYLIAVQPSFMVVTYIEIIKYSHNHDLSAHVYVYAYAYIYIFFFKYIYTGYNQSVKLFYLGALSKT